MELGLIAAGFGVYNYLANQQSREQNFQRENNLGLPNVAYPNVFYPPGMPGQPPSPLIMNNALDAFAGPSRYYHPMPTVAQPMAGVPNNNASLNKMFNNQQNVFKKQFARNQVENFGNGPQVQGLAQGPQQGPVQMPKVLGVQQGLAGAFAPTPNMFGPGGAGSPFGPNTYGSMSNTSYGRQMPTNTQTQQPQTGPFAGVPNPIRSHPSITSLQQQPTNNGVTNDYLLNLNNRPIADFAHNNMVPFSKKYTQNMAGTGVAQGNYIDGVNVETGTDKSTPNQTLLSMFTGQDDTYRSKREAGPLFSPAEQQTNWVFGQPLFREDDERFKQVLTYRNDLAPSEAIMVGPGLNLDPTVPAAGGFHDFTRVMPNNVSDYKANQLPGRVNEGRLLTAGLPTAYPGVGGTQNKSAPGVPKYRPPRDWSQARRPTMTTKVGFVNGEAMLRADYQVDNRPKNPQREQISWGYGQAVPKTSQNSPSNAALKDSNKESYCVDVPMTIGIAPARPMGLNNRSPTYMSQDNNIRSKSDCNSVPLNGPSPAVKKTGPMISNYYVNETDRGSVNPQNVEQLNLKGPNIISSYNYDDTPKTTMKETTEYSYAGDASRPSQGSTFYTYDDAPKTTMKETNEYSYAGDASRPSQGSKFYTYDDAPKTTMKETNEYSYAGDASRPTQGSKFYTFKDAPRSTIKQSTNFSYAGDANRAKNGAKFYTWEDGPKNTIKQSTNFSYIGVANTGKSRFTETSRYLYTGPEDSASGPVEKFENLDIKDTLKKAMAGGADTYTIKGSTLVKDYMPGAGRMNIRTDPDDMIGAYSPGTFGNDSNLNGPGTLLQALPDGSRYQFNQIMAVPRAAPNKLMAVDDRQLASYQNEQLKNNPLSMYTNNRDGGIPSFMNDVEPTDYSDMITVEDDAAPDNSNKQKFDMSMPVYPKNNNTNNGINGDNPNSVVVYNSQTENDYNPLISSGSSRLPNSSGSIGVLNDNPNANARPRFEGHGYSGKFDPNATVETQSGSVQVYGPTCNYRPMGPGDRGLQSGPVRGSDGTVLVAEQNPALAFSNSLMLNSQFDNEQI
jgi:hypothetical protein